MMRNYAQLWLSSIAIAALIASAGAQTWDETANGGGDAGDLPATAQVVSGSGPLTAITGVISSSTDVDMFQILICDPAAFKAWTTGALSDTQLWLFDENGNALWHNDDRPGDVAQPGQGLLSLLHRSRLSRKPTTACQMIQTLRQVLRVPPLGACLVLAFTISPSVPTTAIHAIRAAAMSFTAVLPFLPSTSPTLPIRTA
jgi:hypothetical protein